MLDRPSSLDPASSNENVRQRICEEITGSGFFEWFGMEPINLSYTSRQRYSLPEQRPPEDTNPLRPRLIAVREPTTKHLYHIKEYVFLCQLKRRWSEELIPYYISKEYNLSVGAYKAARFVFGEERFVILAEESGHAYMSPDFNIEVYYLEMRMKYHFQPPSKNSLLIFSLRCSVLSLSLIHI